MCETKWIPQKGIFSSNTMSWLNMIIKKMMMNPFFLLVGNSWMSYHWSSRKVNSESDFNDNSIFLEISML
jgi:hypothetical protein